MADWEPLAGVIFAGVILTTWAPWFGDVFRVNHLTSPKSYRLGLALTPVICVLFLLLCIKEKAPATVRESGLYVALYLAAGAAALGVSAQVFPFLGISARDDVLERGNAAALTALLGALIGATLSFAGGTMDGRPGVAFLVATAGTALCVWWLLWYVAELLGDKRTAERITVDRDGGTGIRLAGLLIANGAILGVASAGGGTPSRFASFAWPALVLTIFAAVAERLLASRSVMTRSILVAVSYLIVAILCAMRRRLGA